MFIQGQHLVDAGSGPCQGLEGASAERIHTNATRPKIVGQVSYGRLQGCLADSHDVIAGDAFFATEVGHGGNGCLLAENILGGIGDG